MTNPIKRTPRKEDAPCYECPDRHTACSDHCQKPEYLAWKERKKTIVQNRIKQYTVDSYVTARSGRIGGDGNGLRTPGN